jgi:copper transport protein
MFHPPKPSNRGRIPSPRPKRPRGVLLAALMFALLLSPSAAWAHAQLVGTSPQSGATVRVQPSEVIFRFGEQVGGMLGAVRVYDAQGSEVDDLNVSHPGGDPRRIGVGLRSHLPDGTYTATYRVISADTHIVYGGLVFNIGHAGATPRFTVAGLIAKNRSGQVTEIAFGVVRGLNYLTIALMLGSLAFLLVAWPPGMSAVAGEEERWQIAARAFGSRMRALIGVAVVLGMLVSVMGVLLQGASASGQSLWGSLNGIVIEGTLEGRFGVVWGLRAIDWALIGLALVAGASFGGGPRGVKQRGAGHGRVTLGVLILASAYLAITPALAGHASVESPVGVFFPADVLHVLAASIWVGGIACLLIALPGATRLLQGAERSGLLLSVLTRFSSLALGSVAVIALTGVVQAYIDVRSLHGLLHSTYGALIIAKVLLLAALIGLGWVNRERVIPALRRIVGDGGAPGGTGALARRTMRGELALMLCVFGVTAALISYSPPVDAEAGPFSINTTIGAAELEMTVEPAQVGLNLIHLYLIDARTGAQFTATKELTVTAKLPAKGIGPLVLKANAAGPGHYVLDSTVLSPGGTWEIEVTDRVSEFEQHTRTIAVPIR